MLAHIREARLGTHPFDGSNPNSLAYSLPCVSVRPCQMKLSQALALEMLLVAVASCMARSSPVCSNECQSTLTQLRREVVELRLQIVELELLLSKSNLTRTSGDTEKSKRGSVKESSTRALLQSASGPYSSDGLIPQNGPAEVPAGHASRVPDRRAVGSDAVVRLGLLMDITGTAGGKYISGAATLAIADVNADPSLMQGRRLEYIYADSGCNSITGVTAS